MSLCFEINYSWTETITIRYLYWNYSSQLNIDIPCGVTSLKTFSSRISITAFFTQWKGGGPKSDIWCIDITKLKWFTIGLGDIIQRTLRSVKLPWIFPGAPLTSKGFPEISRVTFSGMGFVLPFPIDTILALIDSTGIFSLATLQISMILHIAATVWGIIDIHGHKISGALR